MRDVNAFQVGQILARGPSSKRTRSVLRICRRVRSSYFTPRPDRDKPVRLGAIRIAASAARPLTVTLFGPWGPQGGNRHAVHFALHATPSGCLGGPCVRPDHLRWGTHRENMADVPREVRVAATKRVMTARLAKQTPEQRRAARPKSLANTTPEQRSKSAREMWVVRTPEQRSAIMRKAWVARKRNRDDRKAC